MSTTNEEELQQLKLSLKKELWFDSIPMYLYQGLWTLHLDSIYAFQNHFQAQDTDIFITSMRKTGTTWLKSLLFSILNRVNNPPSQSPLLTHNPHELIPQLETNIYTKSRCPNLETGGSQRIFGSHLPYHALPCSIKESKCKIIYITRNPLDTFISSWLFYLNLEYNKSVTPDMMELYFNKFCEGRFPFGPFEDHVLGYWQQSLDRGGEVLFVRYEDLKADPKTVLRKLAEFIGCPFSEEEEKENIIDGIIQMCSIQNLREVEVNKNGRVFAQFQNKFYFRKGEVGDWVNYLSPSMVEKLKNIMEEKFLGSGLTFDYLSN